MHRAQIIFKILGIYSETVNKVYQFLYFQYFPTELYGVEDPTFFR
jgi:hypothetical protein